MALSEAESQRFQRHYRFFKWNYIFPYTSIEAFFNSRQKSIKELGSEIDWFKKYLRD